MPTPSLSAEATRKSKVAFVVQRCGDEVNGGAEALCLQLAREMATLWETEVLTTCALDYMTWANRFAPGVEVSGATSIRRFPVFAERDVEAFNRLSEELLARQRLCTSAEQQKWMRAQGPYSPALTEYISGHVDDYDAFIFFGYLYATTFDNLPLVAHKALLAPLSHDEWPIYFTLFDRLFAQPRGFIFNTGAEREFTRRRFFHLEIDGPVAGIGISPPPNLEPERFRQTHGIARPFLLYCGRIDPSKGCAEMFAAFIRWQAERPLPYKLVLVGKAAMEIPSHPDIVHAGFLSEAEKWSAMAACDWLLMPSQYESLSIVLLETWAAGRPALVNARTPVLVEHIDRSKGGFAFDDWDEARAVIESCTPAETGVLGEHGRAYVQAHYTWPEIRKRYQEALGPIGVRAPLA